MYECMSDAVFFIIIRIHVFFETFILVLIVFFTINNCKGLQGLKGVVQGVKVKDLEVLRASVKHTHRKIDEYRDRHKRQKVQER